VAFSCKGRGLCPSCGAKRAAELAAFLTDEVVEDVGHAQWVFTIPTFRDRASSPRRPETASGHGPSTPWPEGITARTSRLDPT
jgi:hypothetical protein